jgi:hypothetical protein
VFSRLEKNINGTCESIVDVMLQLGLTSDRQAYCDQWNKEITKIGPIHLQQQENMAALSSNSIWKVYWNARHMIQWDDPVQLAHDILQIVKNAEKRG